jgi:ABC-type phosphate transport system auxiliary subunit
MSTPIAGELPPELKLAELDTRRDSLFAAAQENRRAVAARLDELRVWKREETIDADYDESTDHRVASLLAGAEQWEAEAAKVAAQADALRAAINPRTMMRSRARAERTTA